MLIFIASFTVMKVQMNFRREISIIKNYLIEKFSKNENQQEEQQRWCHLFRNRNTF